MGLTAEQRAILRTKRFSGRHTAAELLEILKPLAKLDASRDKHRRRLGCSFSALIVVLLLVWLVPRWQPAAPYLAGVVLVLGVLYVRSRMQDLSNNLRDFIVPLIALLREDVRETEPFDITLDLSPPLSRSKKGATTKTSQKNRNRKARRTRFTNEFFRGAVRLADSTLLRWTLTDNVNRIKISQTGNRSTKYKTKIKKKTVLKLVMSVSTKRYEVLGEQWSAGARRRQLKVKRIYWNTSVDAISPSVFLHVVGGLYRQLEPVRKQS